MATVDERRVRTRLAQVRNEVQALTKALDDGRIEQKRFDGQVTRLYDEYTNLQSTLENVAAAKRLAGAQEMAFGAPQMKNKMIGGPVRSAPPSPMDLSEAQLHQLYHAVETKTPLTLEIHSKAAYTPVTEYSPTGTSTITGGIGQLPPIIVPNRFMSLPYEPSRVSQYLPSAAMNGPSAVWLTHTGNATEAATVGEAAQKMDIGPTVVENQVKPTKIAGLVSVSLEAWQDYGEFGEWLPTELTRSLINSESNMLINAGTSGGPTATFPGLLATTGTLTRDVGTDTALDALNKSFVDVRVGPAYAEPDLVITHPATIAAMRREKDASGRYILDLFAGPLALTADGAPRAATAPDANLGGVIPQGTNTTVQSIWGVPVVETTQCPPGTAIVMSVRAGAALFYVRLGMLLQFNMFGDQEWQQNLFSWRVEERIALATPRPEAINILTGLPTS